MNGATVRERLESALREHFDDVRLELSPVESGRISGLVITSHFSGQDTDGRQDDVWHVVRDALGAESIDVSTLITLTPDEYDDMVG